MNNIIKLRKYQTRFLYQSKRSFTGRPNPPKICTCGKFDNTITNEYKELTSDKARNEIKQSGEGFFNCFAIAGLFYFFVIGPIILIIDGIYHMRYGEHLLDKIDDYFFPKN